MSFQVVLQQHAWVSYVPGTLGIGLFEIRILLTFEKTVITNVQHSQKLKHSLMTYQIMYGVFQFNNIYKLLISIKLLAVRALLPPGVNLLSTTVVIVVFFKACQFSGYFCLPFKSQFYQLPSMNLYGRLMKWTLNYFSVFVLDLKLFI